jgi:hypothetical protein
MIRSISLSGALVVALSGVAFAQAAPAPAAAPPVTPPAAASRPWAERGAAFALRGAYRTIAEAEALGAATYLDAARSHYRSALTRYGAHDAGAAGEAMAAAALARASMAEHPALAARDLPAPPDIAVMTAPAGPQLMRGRGRFDASRVASDARLVNTAEAKDLAQKALDADIARSRASFAGNGDEAMRQGRIASALASAVRSLAMAEHPPMLRMRRGIVGDAADAGNS